MPPFPHRGPNINQPDAAAMRQAAAAADELVKGLDAVRDAERAYAVALTDPAHQAARAEAEALKEANAELARVLGLNRQATDRLAAVQSGSFLRGYAEELRAKQRLTRASGEEARQRLRLEQTMFRRSNPVEQARATLLQMQATQRFQREQQRAALTARLGLSRRRELADARDRLGLSRLQATADRRQERAGLTAHAGLSDAELTDTARESAANTQMRAEQTERIAAAERRIRGEQLASGSTLQQYRDRLKSIREEANVRRSERNAERRAGYEQRFGKRAGGALADAAEFGGRPGVAGGFGLAAAASGLFLREAMRGLQGTVSQARFDNAREQFDREAAGPLVPIQEKATGLLQGGADWFGRQSNTTRKGIVYGSAAVTAAGVIGGGQVAWNMGSGLSKDLTGKTLGSRFSTAAGFGEGGMFTRAGIATRGGAAASRLAPLGPYALPAAVIAGGAKVLSDTPDYYTHMRDQGRSRFPSAAFALGGSVWDNAVGIPNAFGAGIPTVDEKILKKKPGADLKDEAVPAGGGFGELGSGFDRLTMAADMKGIGLDAGDTSQQLAAMNRTLERI